MKRIKVVKASKRSFIKKGLKKGNRYKFRVVAQKKTGGKYRTVAKTRIVHIVAGNSYADFTNPVSLRVKPAKITLQTGKSRNIRTVISKVEGGKQLLKHASTFRYKSSDKSVAKVSKKGKVTAVGKGKCRIYVQAVNGIWKTVTVTVN